jgi:hypothetical protein
MGELKDLIHTKKIEWRDSQRRLSTGGDRRLKK